MIERACEHMGTERATRYLRKFYPWYVERIGGTRALQAEVQHAASIAAVRELLQRRTGPRRPAGGVTRSPRTRRAQ